MKLAEALILRSDCQKRIAQLNQRLSRSATVQEGETPLEDPRSLLTELDASVAELADLIKCINRTNSGTVFNDAVFNDIGTIADALAEREMLLLKRNSYEVLIDAASYQNNRYSRTEIKTLSTVNVAEIRAEMDQLSRQIRELDTRIQSANWTIDLIESIAG